MKSLLARMIVSVALTTVPIVAAAQPPISISQKFRSFHPGRITIAAGQTLDFLNDDQFVHQLYVDSPDFHFESQEQPPGQTIAITFKHPGTYAVHCHIHPLMRLIVVVVPRPKA